MVANFADGESIATAAPITALDSGRGIEQENRYLRAKFGREGMDWFFRLSKVIADKGRWYDCVVVETADRRVDVYFDITFLMEAHDAMLRAFGSQSRHRATIRQDRDNSLSSFSQLMWQAQHCWARISRGAK